MPVLFGIQNGFLLIVTLALFALQAWAFVDALSHRAEAYVAADKQTKQMWMILIGVALAAHMLIWSPISILNLVGAVITLVYLLEVRPALRSLKRN